MSSFAKEILENDIERELKKSYLSYAMSIIINRALPDVKDGLKPVHRRILYAMYKLNNVWNKPFKKSARIVGDVIGKYHPHGDTAVYDAIVRMAQKFTLRYTLLEGQGNFGSIDGDPAAAMRYTEIKLSKITNLLLDDITKNTVKFIPNYDATEIQPSVLPAKIPNLLINGTTGIAVGLATNIPPHNLVEVITATLELIDNQNIKAEELLTYIPGPDFPTAGIILGNYGILQAYATGKGTIEIKAKSLIIKNKIVITELPYQVNKAKLIEKIIELIKNKKIDGITNLTDESDKDGLRIVIETSKQNNPNIILDTLYNNTTLKTTYGINMVVLCDSCPKLLTLKEILIYFINHRKKIITNKLNYEIYVTSKRLHILEGLLIAYKNIDLIIDTIKKENIENTLKSKLIISLRSKGIILSDSQIKAILELQLSKLANLEKEKIEDETLKITQQIKYNKEIINDENKLKDYIKEELNTIKKEFVDTRKTQIEETESTIKKVNYAEVKVIILFLSYKNYIKKECKDDIKTQKRGGKGKYLIKFREHDFVLNFIVCTTHDKIYFFSVDGFLYKTVTNEMMKNINVEKNISIINYIPDLPKNKIIKTMLNVENINYINTYFIFISEKGFVKKTNINKYAKQRKKGILVIKLRPNDNLIDVNKTNNVQDNLMILTNDGKLICIKANNIKETGKNTQGVIGIKVNTIQKVINSVLLENITHVTQYLFSATENGYGKCTKITEFKSVRRGGQGIRYMKKTEKNGFIINSIVITHSDDILLVSFKGLVTRIKANDVPVTKRNTQGVLLINLDKGDKLVQIRKLSNT